MENGIFEKPVKIAKEFKSSLADIYWYSFITFGEVQAVRYDNKILEGVRSLSCYYMSYPPCLQIPTKNNMYRNIILDAHKIIYRITKEHIEVLDIIHQASSITKIRKTRSIRL